MNLSSSCLLKELLDESQWVAIELQWATSSNHRNEKMVKYCVCCGTHLLPNPLARFLQKEGFHGVPPDGNDRQTNNAHIRQSICQSTKVPKSQSQNKQNESPGTKNKTHFQQTLLYNDVSVGKEYDQDLFQSQSIGHVGATMGT